MRMSAPLDDTAKKSSDMPTYMRPLTGLSGGMAPPTGPSANPDTGSEGWPLETLTNVAVAALWGPAWALKPACDEPMAKEGYVSDDGHEEAEEAGQ